MNDADSLAAALAPLMADHDLRLRQGQYATQSMQQYRPELCFDRWENVLRDVGA